MRLALTALVLGFAVANPAHAEFELSFYTGFQTAPHSDVEGNDPNGIGKFDFTTAWEGRSNEMPPYWGIRGTWWQPNNIGYALEMNHAKVYADENDKEKNGFDILEFSDGINLVTVNVLKRWPSVERPWIPYVGAGVGVSVPHVEVETSSGKTFEYQLTGPAVQWLAGVSYPVSENWSVFGEYKGTYSQNEADLHDGGDLKTNIVTNALNVGVSFNF
ncbi:outer membrane protein [Qingshengfaniella alkalisoli]